MKAKNISLFVVLLIMLSGIGFGQNTRVLFNLGCKVEMSPANPSPADTVIFYLKWSLGSTGDKVSKTFSIDSNQIFITSCYSLGLGLSITNFIDTFKAVPLKDIVYKMNVRIRPVYSYPNHECKQDFNNAAFTFRLNDEKPVADTIRFDKKNDIINGLIIIPAKPDPGDSVTIIHYSFSMKRKIDASFSINNNKIDITSCFTNDSIFHGITDFDTISLGILQKNIYTVNIHNYLSNNPSTCVKSDSTLIAYKFAVGDTIIKEAALIQSINFAIYPNPTTDLVTLVGDNILKTEVFDITGRSQGLFYGKEIDLGNLPAGIYFLNVYGKIGLVKKGKVVLAK